MQVVIAWPQSRLLCIAACHRFCALWCFPFACGGLGLLARIWLTGLQPVAVPSFLKDADMGISAMLAPRLLWKAGQSLHGIACWPATVLLSKVGGTAVQSNLGKVAHIRAAVLLSMIMFGHLSSTFWSSIMLLGFEHG